MSIITVIGVLLVAGIIYYAIDQLMPANPFKRWALVLLVVVVALFFIKMFTGVGPNLGVR
jgi:hypothetical protein